MRWVSIHGLPVPLSQMFVYTKLSRFPSATRLWVRWGWRDVAWPRVVRTSERITQPQRVWSQKICMSSVTHGVVFSHLEFPFPFGNESFLCHLGLSVKTLPSTSSNEPVARPWRNICLCFGTLQGDSWAGLATWSTIGVTWGAQIGGPHAPRFWFCRLRAGPKNLHMSHILNVISVPLVQRWPFGNHCTTSD